MSFAPLGLHPLLERALRGLGFTEPTPIQAQLVPLALGDRDLLGLAPTGTGKTLAFLLPLAHRLLSEPPPIQRGPRTRLPSGKRKRPAGRVDPRMRLRAIVLCPTRELAQQVAKDAADLFRGSLLRVAAVWGKSALGPQRDAVAEGIDLLVGTPGRVRELLDLDALSLAYVRHAVVDEADRMLDLGFLPQVEGLLARMPDRKQLVLLSATCPSEVDRLVERVQKEPMRVEAGEHSRPARHVAQTVWRIAEEHKVPLLLQLLADTNRTGVMVFTRTRRRAGWVATALRNHGISAELLHGDRSQAQREKALATFAAGRARVLVATDVAARGLHVPAARTVVNYDLPVLPEEFVHRVGRAGHGGGFAESFSFVAEDDAPARGRIERLVGEPLRPEAPPDVSAFVRERPPPRRPAPNAEARVAARMRDIVRLERDEARRGGRPDAKPAKPAKDAKATKPSKPAKGAVSRRGEEDRTATPGKHRGPSRLRRESRQPIPRTEKPGRGVRRLGPGGK